MSSIELRTGISEARYCAAWYHQSDIVGSSCQGSLIVNENEGSGGRLSEDIWSLASEFRIRAETRDSTCCDLRHPGAYVDHSYPMITH